MNTNDVSQPARDARSDRGRDTPASTGELSARTATVRVLRVAGIAAFVAFMVLMGPLVQEHSGSWTAVAPTFALGVLGLGLQTAAHLVGRRP